MVSPMAGGWQPQGCYYNEGNTMLPQISPAPLTSLKEPIGHPNWIYELKHDGFRGVLYVDREQAWLVSRKGKKFRQFDPLLKQVLRCLKGKRAILDGEMVTFRRLVEAVVEAVRSPLCRITLERDFCPSGRAKMAA